MFSRLDTILHVACDRRRDEQTDAFSLSIDTPPTRDKHWHYRVSSGPDDGIRYVWTLCVPSTAVEVLNGVSWSDALDETFRQAYQRDADISWQYFCSFTGFLRHFPGP